jgi:hypothetical protein
MMSDRRKTIYPPAIKLWAIPCPIGPALKTAMMDLFQLHSSNIMDIFHCMGPIMKIDSSLIDKEFKLFSVPSWYDQTRPEL